MLGWTTLKVSSKTEKNIRGWGGNNSQSDFRLFYLSGSLLRTLNELVPEEDQAELIASLVREHYYEKFGRYPDG